MKKYFIYLSLVLLSININSQERDILYENDIKSFIKFQIIDLEKSNVFIEDSILSKIWGNDQKLVDLFNPGQFSWVRNFGIKTKEDVIQFDNLFSEEEFASMKKQIQNSKIKKWSELIDKKFFQSKEANIKNKYLSISIPVFNKDKNIAVIYFEFPNSGELRIYKKEENKTWKYIANGLVWRAD